MGHYWSEMRGPETEGERQSRHAKELADKLMTLPASRFTIKEIKILTRCGWSEWRHDYGDSDEKLIFEMAKREGIS